MVTGLFVAAAFASPQTRGQAFSAVVSAQGVQDTLYIITDGKLIGYDTAQSDPKTIIELSDYPGIPRAGLLLTSDQSALYALSPAQGILYLADGTELRETVHLDLSQLGQAREDGLRYVIFDHPVIRNDALFVLYTDPEAYGDKALYRFSLADGKGEKIETGARSLSELASYQHEQLMAVDCNTMELVPIDTQSGKVLQPFDAFKAFDDGSIAYDPQSKRLFFIHGTELMASCNQKTETVDYLPFNGAAGAAYAGLWDGHYVVLDTTGLYVCATKAQQTAASLVTLWYRPNTFPFPEVLNKFMLENPGTYIVARGTEGDDPLEILTSANMSRDGSIDIFVLPSYLVDSQQIFRRGYAQPLNSELLKNDALTMYPQIRSYLMREDTLLGYPVDIYPDYMTVRLALLEEAGFDGIPQTVDEYLDRMLQWYDENYNSCPSYSFDGSATVAMQWRHTAGMLIGDFIRAYAPDDGPISFDRPSFRSALERLAALAQWKNSGSLVPDHAGTAYVSGIFDHKAVSPFSQDSNPETQGETYMLPPTFTRGEQPVISASMVYFIVNPSSPNKDAAIKFLEFYCQNMELATRYMLHPAMNDPVERPNYQQFASPHRDTIANINKAIEKLEAANQALLDAEPPPAHNLELRRLREKVAAEEAALAKIPRWKYDAQAIQEYRRLAPYFSFEHNAFSWRIHETLGAVDILMRYFEGVSSIDQALRELDRRAAMMYREGQ